MRQWCLQRLLRVICALLPSLDMLLVGAGRLHSRQQVVPGSCPSCAPSKAELKATTKACCRAGLGNVHPFPCCQGFHRATCKDGKRPLVCSIGAGLEASNTTLWHKDWHSNLFHPHMQHWSRSRGHQGCSPQEAARGPGERGRGSQESLGEQQPVSSSASSKGRHSVDEEGTGWLCAGMSVSCTFCVSCLSAADSRGLWTGPACVLPVVPCHSARASVSIGLPAPCQCQI